MYVYIILYFVLETYPEMQKIFLLLRNIANMAHHVEKWDKAMQTP